jgi:hemerythrin
MPGIRWNDRYSVGIKKFDEQHQKLIEILNDLHGAMSSGKSREILGNILADLITYTKTHFANEENLMQLYKFPGYSAHKVIHDTLTQKVVDFQKAYKEGSSSIGVEILGFLNRWLVDHIQGTDKGYTAFLNGKGVN